MFNHFASLENVFENLSLFTVLKSGKLRLLLSRKGYEPVRRGNEICGLPLDINSTISDRKILKNMKERFFTLDEARALLPELKQLVAAANKDLDGRTIKLQDLNQRYLRAERALDDCQPPEDENESSLKKFRQQRANFELAISQLSQEQSEFVRSLESWVDKISGHGVIIRKIKEGLIDFPSRNGEFKYFLCWQFGEDEITHWHLANDGFIGRKSLVTLCEYC